ncbi:MAG: hypothetical protein K2N54_01335 [Helicobacter sp.]|nr:hypothetical protein [Helicobacter sp.]
MCVALAYVNSPQRMRQRYAYGSNIAAVRCGWDACMMSNSRFYFLSLQANVTSVAINRQRIPTH